VLVKVLDWIKLLPGLGVILGVAIASNMTGELSMLSSDARVLMFETSSDENYLLWSYKTGADVCSVAISGDGRYAAVSNVDGVLYLFEVENACPLWDYSAGNGASEVSISSDGQFIAAYLDGAIFSFDRFDNEPHWSYRIGVVLESSVSISADGRYILGGHVAPVAAYIYDSLFLFSRENNIPLWIHEGPGVISASISSDGKYIVLAEFAAWRGICLFDDKHVLLWRYAIPQHISELSISSDGSYIIVGAPFFDPFELIGGISGGKVYFFSREENIPLWSYQTGGRVLSVAISSDGSHAVAGSSDNRIYFFSREENIPLWSYQTGGPVHSVAISSDGSHAVAGSSDNRIYFFSREENTPLWSYQTGGEVFSVAISSDGIHVIGGSADDRVYSFARWIPPTAVFEILLYVIIGMITAIAVAGLAFIKKRV
jgi:WD40 repeat protein